MNNNLVETDNRTKKYWTNRSHTIALRKGGIFTKNFCKKSADINKIKEILVL